MSLPLNIIDILEGFFDIFKPVKPVIVDKKFIELLKYKINQYSDPEKETSKTKEQQISKPLKPQKKSIFSQLETLGQSNRKE
ncbi:MAG: hypothetical protein IJL89_07195 [Firmicutes bacterium]|nr:hypothetical protein [Bacillota bacterium]